MHYISPFEKLREEYGDSLFDSNTINLDNIVSFKNVLEELIGVYKKKEVNFIRNKTVALNSPRLLKGILEYNIKNNVHKPEIILNKGIDLCLKLYCDKDDEENLESLLQFQNEVIENYDLYNLIIREKFDFISWEATNSLKSISSANFLKKKLDEKNGPLLFIGLANGGIAPGLDVFLNYCSQSNCLEESIFYTTRFSTRKKKDKEPCLKDSEIEYLYDSSFDKSGIVIFDEDISSGRTILEAKKYFTDIFSNENIVILSNQISNFTKQLNPKFYKSYFEL